MMLSNSKFYQKVAFMLPVLSFKLAYGTYVCSELEYAAFIRDPHPSHLIDAVRAIQNPAARFVTSPYDFCTSIANIRLSQRLNSLDYIRKIARTCLLHKLYFNFSHLHGSLHLPPLRSSRHLLISLNVQNFKGLINGLNKSFLLLPVDDWNRLPRHIANERHPIELKALL